MKPLVPIALFAYARPYHLIKVLKGLKRNHVPLIYAFSDGPKTAALEIKVRQVRKILSNIDWCDVKIFEQEKNLGLGTSIRNGVSTVLKEYDRLIVIEDDLVMRPGAYNYAAEALKQYEDHEEVMTISMWSHRSLVPKKNKNGFFSKRFLPWGWATYKSEWIKYDCTPEEMYEKCKSNGLNILEWGKDVIWQVENAKQRDLWYIGYALCHFLYDKVSYFPNETLVSNIGRDGTGVNEGNKRPNENMKYINKKYINKIVCTPKNWPEISVDRNLSRKFANYCEKNYTLIDFIKKKIKKLLIEILKTVENFLKKYCS